MAESVPVVLARMEGKLDNLREKVMELVPRVSRLEDRTKALEDVTLGLSKDAAAEAKEKVALAKALKEAEEARRAQSEQSWTPVQRFFAVVGAVGVIVALIIQFYSTVKG
jgi:peptidoglycan hydrolase CwlO-like protein